MDSFSQDSKTVSHKNGFFISFIIYLLQVTNPPIDPLREGLVMSLEMRLGSRGNLLQPGPDAYRQVFH